MVHQVHLGQGLSDVVLRVLHQLSMLSPVTALLCLCAPSLFAHMDPLPGFHFVDVLDAFYDLHQCLWRDPGPVPVTGEPEALASHIKVLSANGIDNGGNSTRFIDLDASPDLRIHSLLWPHSSTLLVRDEYREFMEHITKLDRFERRFYVTGQPGIGKSAGACYFLFWLLASGQPTFLFLDTNEILYFSPTGVQSASQRDLNTRNSFLRRTVERSWILIDVDVGTSPGAADWYPGLWINPAAAVIWTSSESGPLYDRRRRSTERYHATTWYMAPWSHDEIAAMIKLEHKNPEDVWARYERSGPVVQTLFYTRDPDTDIEIDQVIRTALANHGLFDFANSQEAVARACNHRIFLIRPAAELHCDDGVSPVPTPILNRSQPTYHFLSGHIISRTLDLLDDDGLTGLFDSAFDDPRTRTAAGQLLERKLRRTILAWPQEVEPVPFGVGGEFPVLTLIGTPHSFSIELHGDALPPRPLYLRPRDPRFVLSGVDAIILTGDTIWLVHTSLGSWHPSVFETMQAILDCLETQGIKVGKLRKVYCIVGESYEGQRLVLDRAIRERKNKLTSLGQVKGVMGRKSLLEELELEAYRFLTNGFWVVHPSPDEDDGEEAEAAKSVSGEQRG
ncbi:hypothetical protein MSAN_00547100 [Mycena sanguinolenta]|uniref:Uncharacterized protein n=1 Tax=Mycena sanguinolenta TaxID=230812 RepID=A0A8H7DGD2_9AGAR|nr:hypothetical protein MSAN_00547100 [Mycena sanguinolenta]